MVVGRGSIKEGRESSFVLPNVVGNRNILLFAFKERKIVEVGKNRTIR